MTRKYWLVPVIETVYGEFAPVTVDQFTRSEEVCSTPVPSHCNVRLWADELALTSDGETVAPVRLMEGTWEAVSWKAVGALPNTTFAGVKNSWSAVTTVVPTDKATGRVQSQESQ